MIQVFLDSSNLSRRVSVAVLEGYPGADISFAAVGTGDLSQDVVAVVVVRCDLTPEYLERVRHVARGALQVRWILVTCLSSDNIRLAGEVGVIDAVIWEDGVENLLDSLQEVALLSPVRAWLSRIARSKPDSSLVTEAVKEMLATPLS